MPEISDTVYVRGRQPRMILSVSFSSLPDMSQNSAGSFLFLFQFSFASRSVHFFSPYHQLELPCTRFLPPLFTSVPHMEAFCRATPALRHWLTYRARFSLRTWPCVCVPFCAALSADLAFALTHSSVGCSSYRVIGWHSHHFLTRNHCPILKIIQPESLYTHDHMIKTQSFEIYFFLFEIWITLL